MLHGWIILDKPVGLGSSTVVSAATRILRAARDPRTKVGHGGTIDPLASGALRIALGGATKHCAPILHPLPRPRHRACVEYAGARHHVETYARRTVRD